MEWIARTLCHRQAQNGPPVLAGAKSVFDPKVCRMGQFAPLGVLAALFQPAVLDGRVPLVGIEEPEIALHPAAAGVPLRRAH